MMLLLLSSTLLISTSYLFTRLRHPLAMGLTLITQTLLVCMFSSMMSTFVWFSYILFLIFLGATLVLFVYVASLASNEMFKLSYPLAFIIMFPLLFIPLLFMKDELVMTTKPSLEPSTISPSEILNDPSFMISMIYNPSSSFLTSYMILYLLLTLIIIVKLSSYSEGPLRLS